VKRPWDAVVWWERRRIPFNAIVLVAGAVSLVVVELIGSYFVAPGEDVEEPLGIIAGVVAYGIAANLAYTLGWVSELLWSWGDTTRTEEFRSRVFRIGVIFSVIVTLLPVVLIPIAWAIWGFQHGPN